MLLCVYYGNRARQGLLTRMGEGVQIKGNYKREFVYCLSGVIYHINGRTYTQGAAILQSLWYRSVLTSCIGELYYVIFTIATVSF